ncbi:UvrD-helicase domain-containing protein [Saccharothrix sp. DSM 118769]
MTSPTLYPGRSIPVEPWRPIGIDDLEPAAWQALRDTDNVAVVAGPGAGKTEFLAQRAAYLLQTGLCPVPQRILAISFKRDAAANLGRRVAARVPEHADRFVSMTFDAFTKGLVDRFAPALPSSWRMDDGYEINFVPRFQIDSVLIDLLSTAPHHMRRDLASITANRFVTDVVGGWNLPVVLTERDLADSIAYAAMAWWRQRYLRPGKASLDFVMLNRLAELLVRSAPKLRRALRITYPFVFVDEFQDTTSAQFSFLESVFSHGPAVTAVGDDKQRIMGWAGALPRAIQHFTAAFDATPYPLTWNFRSSHSLVQLQHVIASRLDANSVPAVSKVAEGEAESAELWMFSSLDREAAFIAAWMAEDMARSGRAPKDYALIVRQKVSDFESRFRVRLAAHDIRVRNDDAQVGEMRLQDLLKNGTAQLLIGLLLLANQRRGLATVWRAVSMSMERMHGAIGDEAAQRRVGETLSELIALLRNWLEINPPVATSAADTVKHLLSLLDAEVLRRYVKSSSPSEDLDVTITAFRERLGAVMGLATD